MQASHEPFVTKFKPLKGPTMGAIEGGRVAVMDGVELFSTVEHRLRLSDTPLAQ
ncbi:MAG: hypothetical protein ACYC64_20425 [Armatimonadota bacterium]